MKAAIIAVISIGVAFAIPHTQEYFVELDLDGQLGNGPDVGAAAVGDTIAVEVWMVGEGCGLLGSWFTLCNDSGSLNFIEITTDFEPPWIEEPPTVAGTCVSHLAIDFTFSAPIPIPFHHGTILYRVANEQPLSEIEIDSANGASGYVDFCTGLGGTFEGGTGCTIVVGATETETEDWGAIKNLFR